MENKNMLEYGFYYKNELGCETKLHTTRESINIETPLEALVEEFRCFLKAIGFTDKNANAIDIIEDDE